MPDAAGFDQDVGCRAAAFNGFVEYLHACIA